MGAMFELEQVSFGYRAGTDVLRDLSLVVAPGEYVAVVGANGSGKSTLARHLNGLLVPRRGRVMVRGLDTRDPSTLPLVRQLVGMVFQDPDNQIVATTVEDDVAFGLENLALGPEEIAERVDWALGVTGLEALRERPPHLLSGGQKQRLAIASALAMRQEALVLDEATSMLDSAGRRDLLQLVRDLHRGGTTIVTVTHRMDEVLDAGRVVVLDHGQLALTGTPRDVFRAGEQLRLWNLDVPAVAQVAARVHAKVPRVPADCLAPDELIEALTPLVGAGAALPEPSAQASPPLPGSPAVTVEHLAHIYLSGTPLAQAALEDASLDLRAGEAVALVGATGSGKSTLMQHLNGLYRPQRGTVEAIGMNLGDTRVDVVALRRQVGLLFQSPEDQLFHELVGDDVAYAAFQARLPLREVRDRVRWALETVGLDFETFKDRPVFALSGGEKRRVALAGVLAMRPRVLVLDEPTAGLDPLSAKDLLERLSRLVAEGLALVFVTHSLEEALGLADRLVILSRGRTAAILSTDEVVRDPSLVTRHGFELPPLLELEEGLRQRGLPVTARTPDQLAEQILTALHAPVGGWSR
jgi:energy-coupling factor transporter ATPase